jgi:hypothetical protein
MPKSSGSLDVSGVIKFVQEIVYDGKFTAVALLKKQRGNIFWVVKCRGFSKSATNGLFSAVQ